MKGDVEKPGYGGAEDRKDFKQSTNSMSFLAYSFAKEKGPCTFFW